MDSKTSNQNNPYAIIRQFLKLENQKISQIFTALPSSYFQNNTIPEDKTEKIKYLRRLKSESPEIYVYLIWATKDCLEGVRNFENADIPPIKPYLACSQNAVKKIEVRK